jgi:hypothetical protein
MIPRLATSGSRNKAHAGSRKRFVPQLATLCYASSRCAITILVSPLEPNSVFGYVDIVAGPTQVESFVYVRRAVLKRQASAQEAK